MRKIKILYDLSDLYVSNVSDCVKDGEVIIYRGLRGTGLFIRRGHRLFVWGPEPTRPHSWLRTCYYP